MKNIITLDKIKAALFGLSVGDALGVPVEFKTREYLKTNPVKGITGYGSWNQPPGTWSDDSSLAFCLAESLSNGYDINDIAQNFIKWMSKGYWGAHHTVFDVGGATRYAITRLASGTSPSLSGGMMEDDNGNGSLMRIIPLLFSIQEFPIEERYLKVKEVSSITHAHFRSVFACFIYIEIGLQVIKGKPFAEAFSSAIVLVNEFANANDFNKQELDLFKSLLHGDISKQKESTISSGGYVLHTLEATVWCLFKTNNYSDAVLKAVNLGGDTDTTGCVTGGLAGLVYGYDDIPKVWIDEIARKNDIDDLCVRLYKQVSK
ncbi:MAG: ADP-ribosylglycohydrolase family protein [Chitinophagaceae bacterium]